MKIEIYKDFFKDGVVKLITNIQKTEYSVKVDINDQPDLLNIKNYYQKDNGNFWVAHVNGEVIGTIALLDLKNGFGGIRKVFVKKEYRGLGVSKTLLDNLIRYAIVKEFSDLYLTSVDVYKAALKFYEKNNFNKIAMSELPKDFPMLDVDNVSYHLQLKK